MGWRPWRKKAATPEAGAALEEGAAPEEEASPEEAEAPEIVEPWRPEEEPEKAAPWRPWRRKPAPPRNEEEEEEPPPPDDYEPPKPRPRLDHPIVRLSRWVVYKVRNRRRVRPEDEEGSEEGASDDGEESYWDGGDSSAEADDDVDFGEEGKNTSWQAATPFTFKKGAGADSSPAPPELDWDDWDAPLQPLDFKNLQVALRNTHPKFRNPEELVPDARMKEKTRQMMNKKRHFNWTMVAGEKYKGPGRGGNATCKGAHKIPHAIVVFGHGGRGGNAGMNGVYQKYPDEFCSRPVYQKFLEKRAISDSPPSSPVRREWIDNDRDTYLAKRYNQNAHDRVRLPPQDEWPVEITPSRNAWFMFFDDNRGAWCIGPKVGGREIFARCPGADELVPEGLRFWEVWDVGKKAYYEHKTMRTAKGH